MTEQSMSTAPESAPEIRSLGTPVIVDIFARTRDDGTVEFTHAWRWGEKGPSQGNDKIIIPTRRPNDPETPMHFHLRDQTDPKRGLIFSDKQGAAMWVKRDSCPPDQPRCDDAQIPPAEMETGLKLLKVVNINSEKCTLHYRLWFKDREGEWESYDPEIINGGKGQA
jgi:hypothetical protein